MLKNELASAQLLCNHSDSTLTHFLTANEYEIADTVDALSIYDKWKYNFSTIINVLCYIEK